MEEGERLSKDIMNDNTIVLVDCGDATFNIFFRTIKQFIATKDEEWIDANKTYDWSLDEDFMNLFMKQYESCIEHLSIKYCVEPQHIFIIKDSPREVIWRKKIFPDYKGNRKNVVSHSNITFRMGNFFKKTYRDILPQLAKKYGVHILQIPNAEADDVISIIARGVDISYIIIISSDRDYLQLLDRKNVSIYTLSDISLYEKLDGRNAEEYLLYKILDGDKSDNIPPLFNSRERVNYYLSHPNELYTLIQENKHHREKFDRNRLLIDFNCIPPVIRQEAIRNYWRLITLGS